MAASYQEEFDDTKGVYQNRYFEDGQTTQGSKEKEQKDKELSSKHYTEN